MFERQFGCCYAEIGGALPIANDVSGSYTGGLLKTEAFIRIQIFIVLSARNGGRNRRGNSANCDARQSFHDSLDFASTICHRSPTVRLDSTSCPLRATLKSASAIAMMDNVFKESQMSSALKSVSASKVLGSTSMANENFSMNASTVMLSTPWTGYCSNNVANGLYGFLRRRDPGGKHDNRFSNSLRVRQHQPCMGEKVLVGLHAVRPRPEILAGQDVLRLQRNDNLIARGSAGVAHLHHHIVIAVVLILVVCKH